MREEKGEIPAPLAASRIPMYEIFVKLQTRGRAFFGMELGCEQIIPSDHAGKGLTINSLAEYVRVLRRPGVVAVDEIEIGIVRNVAPQRMRRTLAHRVPAHVRHLVARAVFLQLAVQGETHD